MEIRNSRDCRISEPGKLSEKELQDAINLIRIELESTRHFAENKTETRESIQFMSGMIFYFAGFFVLLSGLVFILALHFFGLMAGFFIYGTFFILTGLYLLFFKPAWFSKSISHWFRQYKGDQPL